jgi:type VI secretion system secreted protein Hcp
MAVDMFIKIDGIKGESADDKHKDEIDVLSWSWGASQSGTMHDTGGGGAGKANFQDLSFTKWVDVSSPKLLKAVSTGEHIKEVVLVARRAGGKAPLEYLKLIMKECLISSVSAGGSGGEDRLTENVTINFAEYRFEYTPQKADGTPGGVMPFAFDIRSNKAK